MASLVWLASVQSLITSHQEHLRESTVMNLIYYLDQHLNLFHLEKVLRALGHKPAQECFFFVLVVLEPTFHILFFGFFGDHVMSHLRGLG